MSYYLVILWGIIDLRHAVHSYESASAENNKNDIMPPIYETIIFGDVADILNEFDNTNSPLETMISGSESDENMEDLLTEYQRYLDKAHKQKMDFLEKNKVNTKNKVPLVRHERYMKNKLGQGVKYDNVYYNRGFSNPNIPLDVLLPPIQKVTSPFDVFLPASPKVTNPIDMFLPNYKFSKFLKKDSLPLRAKGDQDIIAIGKYTNDFSNVGNQQRSNLSKPTPKKPCKMCMMMSHDGYMLQNKLHSEGDSKNSILNSDYTTEQNTLNIRIKVDIQLPKIQDNLGKVINNRSREEDGDSKETSLSVPFPYLNFPIPMNSFGFKKSSASKYYKHDLGHHKKKKFRVNNNKKHKKNIKLPWFSMNASQLLEPLFKESPHNEETFNFSDLLKKDNDSYQQANESSPVYIEKTESKFNEIDILPLTIETKTENYDVNETRSTEKNIYVKLNISSITGNVTDETHKENSVETDYTTMKSNIIKNKEKPMVLQRVRRQISTIKPTTSTSEATTVSIEIAKQTAREDNINETKTQELESATTVPVDFVSQTKAVGESSKDANKEAPMISQKVRRHATTIKPVTTPTVATGVHIDAVNQAAEATTQAAEATTNQAAQATTVPVEILKQTGATEVRSKRQTNETKMQDLESGKDTDINKSEKVVLVDKEATTVSADIAMQKDAVEADSKTDTNETKIHELEPMRETTATTDIVKPTETIAARKKRQTNETKMQELDITTQTDAVEADSKADTNKTKMDELEPVKATTATADILKPTETIAARRKRQTNETKMQEMEPGKATDLNKSEKVVLVEATASVDIATQTDAIEADSKPETNKKKMHELEPVTPTTTTIDIVKPSETVGARRKRQTNETKIEEIESSNVTGINKSEKIYPVDKEATTVSVDKATQTNAVKADSKPDTNEKKMHQVEPVEAIDIKKSEKVLSVDKEATTVPVDIAKQTVTTGARRKRQADITKIQELESVKVRDVKKLEKALSVDKEATTVPIDIMKLTDAVEVTSKRNINETKVEVESVKAMDLKKSEKVLLVDTELTYWPENTRNQTADSSVPHNITTIIVERENQKAKLNMTKETIRNNHTKALEKAIFGDVNWDDVDTVAPVFMSFVGKYLKGVLTFCSSNVCHSMKCAKQACVHRICKPDERWNQRGHCEGSNNTDSVASMQSIMDLPSNVAFEIVDILQERMLGKMYGSLSLCITSKCVSFVTSKRNFLKSKCSMKELNNAGQCPIAKKTKVT